MDFSQCTIFFYRFPEKSAQNNSIISASQIYLLLQDFIALAKPSQPAPISRRTSLKAL